MSSGDESIVGEPEDDLERIVEGVEEVQNTEDQVEEVFAENEEDGENAEKQVVKPKRVIKNPQPKLNEQTLKGPRGLSAIEGYFQRVKFKGRGHEEQDLNVVMKTYEYWCHRLFPKFPFDDCIARLEKLGTKRTTQTQIKRMRMGMDFNEMDKPLSDEENDTGGFVDTVDDPFDQLIPVRNQPDSNIDDEQLERIRQNKEKAERLRQERLRKLREKAQINLEDSSRIFDSGPSSSGLQNSNTDNINNDSSRIIDCGPSTSGLQNFNTDNREDSKKRVTKKKHIIDSDSEDETTIQVQGIESDGENYFEVISKVNSNNNAEVVNNSNELVNMSPESLEENDASSKNNGGKYRPKDSKIHRVISNGVSKEREGSMEISANRRDTPTEDNDPTHELTSNDNMMKERENLMDISEDLPEISRPMKNQINGNQVDDLISDNRWERRDDFMDISEGQPQIVDSHPACSAENDRRKIEIDTGNDDELVMDNIENILNSINTD